MEHGETALRQGCLPAGFTCNSITTRQATPHQLANQGLSLANLWCNFPFSCCLHFGLCPRSHVFPPIVTSHLVVLASTSTRNPCFLYLFPFSPKSGQFLVLSILQPPSFAKVVAVRQQPFFCYNLCFFLAVASQDVLCLFKHSLSSFSAKPQLRTQESKQSCSSAFIPLSILVATSSSAVCCTSSSSLFWLSLTLFCQDVFLSWTSFHLDSFVSPLVH